MATWIGVCKFPNGDVRMTDGDIEHDDITEEGYRHLSASPRYEDLPTCPPKPTPVRDDEDDEGE